MRETQRESRERQRESERETERVREREDIHLLYRAPFSQGILTEEEGSPQLTSLLRSVAFNTDKILFFTNYPYEEVYCTDRSLW